MKSITNYINESSNGSSFLDHVKYSNDDIKKWCKAAGDAYEICNDDDMLLIYKKLNKPDEYGSTIEHIATYMIKKGELFTDDVNLFGH